MSDRLTREFKAQLTTTVESALRRIMFEIMNIFDNSLHDYRMELAQKGEEVARLKIKLQRLEITLKDSKCGGDGEEDKTTTLTDHLKREPEAFPLAREQTPEIPEIDFEVPDDWCAPLGSEVVTKQEEGICPSVRLRPLHIPLWPVPLTKQEVNNRIITPEKKRGRRRDSSSESHIPTRHRWEIQNQKEAQQSPVRNNTVDLKKDPIRLKHRAKGFQGENKDLPEEPDSPLEIHKVDSTEKTLTFPLDITHNDQPSSPPKNELQQPLNIKSESPPPSSPESPDEKEKKCNGHQSLISKWHTMGTSCEEGYVCLVCQKISSSKYRLIEHFRIHTGEKPLKCDLCTETFRYRSQLSMHRRRCCTVIQCDKCEKKFYTKVKFNKHVQMQHKNWTHFCKVCGKGFLMEGRLQNHIRHHNQKDS